jgi:hypothetical protein
MLITPGQDVDGGNNDIDCDCIFRAFLWTRMRGPQHVQKTWNGCPVELIVTMKSSWQCPQGEVDAESVNEYRTCKTPQGSVH